jgi:hypothetical protein
MLQVFHLGVAKLYLDVAFITMATHVCCKCMFEMFDLFFRRILHLFNLGVAKVDLDVAYVVVAILQVYVPNVSSFLDVCCNCFILVLQKYI